MVLVKICKFPCFYFSRNKEEICVRIFALNKCHINKLDNYFIYLVLAYFLESF